MTTFEAYKKEHPIRELTVTDMVGAAIFGALTGMIGIAFVKAFDDKEVLAMLKLLEHLKKTLDDNQMTKIIEATNQVKGLKGKFVVDGEKIVYLQKIQQ